MALPDARDGIDLRALRLGRHVKVRAAMERAGVDAMLLTKAANVEYATGAVGPRGEASVEGSRTLAALLTGGGAVHLFTPDPEAVPAAPVPASVRPAVTFDSPESVVSLAFACGEVAGAARRIAVDRLSRPLAGALDTVFGEPTLIDGDALLLPEKVVKTAEEVACLRRAQALTEATMEAVVGRIVPGVREVDLTGAFLAEMAALGVTTCHVEPVWCALPRAAAAAPWTLPGGLPYRELTGTRPLEEGDLVAIDTAILYEGYMSDFGRTWYCTAGRGRPSVAQRDLFRRWREIAAAVTEACRPGATGAELRRAAVRVAGREPWPQPLYLAHGIGLGGVEPPFIGTDLGEAAEERMVLQPNMVVVIEPYVWEEGVGGYRAEESLLVTETGAERFSRFPYGTFVADGS